MLPIALLLMGCAIWNVTPMILWEIAVLLWLSTLPGMLLLSRTRLDLSLLERFVIGTALGFGITPLVFKALAVFGVWQYSALTISTFNVIALALLSLRGDTTKQSPQHEHNPSHCSHLLALICAIAVALTLVYNFSGIHYANDGSLQMRGLFAVDVPFLIGIMPSFDLYGHLADMHQNGLTYAYHDFTYVLIAVVHQVAGTEYFSLIAYSFPVFGLSLVAISVYAFFRMHRNAVWLTIAVLLLSSVWGDHILTGALSPSYLAGVAVLVAILIVVRQCIRLMRPIRPIGPMLLLLAMSIILIKVKLPIYLLIGGSVGLLGLSYLRKDQRIALLLVAPAITSLPFILLFSEANPYQPAGDFVIGAPLMGYANQLAKVLHVSPYTVDPIIAHFDVELEDLLIPLYTIVHFLRMIVLDARLMLFVLAYLFLRKRIAPHDRWLLRIGGFSMILGIILPILYSPSWFPLAISFYTPELGSFIALISVLVIVAQNWDSIAHTSMRYVVTACLVFGAVSSAKHIQTLVAEKRYKLSSRETAALNWIRNNTPPQAVIASRRWDLDTRDTVNDESFYLYAALSERMVVSEGAKYGSLLASQSDVDDAKGLHQVAAARFQLFDRRTNIDKWFDEEYSFTSWARGHPAYLVASRSDTVKTTEVFERAFGSQDLTVWKIRDR